VSVSGSDRIGYSFQYPLPGYPLDIRVARNTRLDFLLSCEISKSSVFMYRLRLFKVTHIYVLCLLTPEFARNVSLTCLLIHDLPARSRGVRLAKNDFDSVFGSVLQKKPVFGSVLQN